MAYDYENEPKPVRLTGPIASAWERILVGHEWFDGEDAIAAGAQQALIREWNENAPSRVTVLAGYGMRTATGPSHTYFATRREAEAYADSLNEEPELVTVIPVTRVMERDRVNVPPEYRPRVWPTSRW